MFGFILLALTEILLAKQHLRTCVPNSPAKGIEEGTLFELPGKPEVAEFDTTAFVEEHILEFQITMDGASIMDVTHG